MYHSFLHEVCLELRVPLELSPVVFEPLWWSPIRSWGLLVHMHHICSCLVSQPLSYASQCMCLTLHLTLCCYVVDGLWSTIAQSVTWVLLVLIEFCLFGSAASGLILCRHIRVSVLSFKLSFIRISSSRVLPLSIVYPTQVVGHP